MRAAEFDALTYPEQRALARRRSTARRIVISLRHDQPTIAREQLWTSVEEPARRVGIVSVLPRPWRDGAKV